ncbi:MAG TPA: DUF3153 domain-containing protein [Thermosynechococcaceae cyanobacterium]
MQSFLILSAAAKQWLRQWRGVLLVLLSLVLSGCVQSDLSIHFDNPHRGAIVQRLQVSDRFRSLSEATVQQWTKAAEQQARSLGGSVQRSADHDLLITIPFGNATELETKFNRFFAANPAASLEIPEIESHLSVSHSNFLLLERDRLRYDLDLRSLGVSSTEGNLLISSGALVDLAFRLETPWGARSTKNPSVLQPEKSSKDLTWNLIPGEINHIEAVFWLPSPLGIGTMIIVLLVLGGRYLKYPQSHQDVAIPDPDILSSSDR